MALIQLNPSIPVEVVGKGKGYAVGWVDYGDAHNLIWIVALAESGEFWCAPSKDVRAQTNWTMGVRKDVDQPHIGDAIAKHNSILADYFDKFILLNHHREAESPTDDRLTRDVIPVPDLIEFLRDLGIYTKRT